jgi:ATP synthase protein I
MVGTQGGPGDSSEDGSSFEERLRAARGRQGLEQAPKQGPDTDPSPWGIGIRVGVELVSALIAGLAIGWALDRWLHTKPVFLAIFVLIGGAAGVLNVWRLFAPRGSEYGNVKDQGGQRTKRDPPG